MMVEILEIGGQVVVGFSKKERSSERKGKAMRLSEETDIQSGKEGSLDDSKYYKRGYHLLGVSGNGDLKRMEERGQCIRG